MTTANPSSGKQPSPALPGPDYPHRILDTSDAPLKYLSISTMEEPEICEYPDSGKHLAEGSLKLACGNFALTVVLLQKFAEAAARLVPQWEIIGYAHDDKFDAPSGIAREFAARLSKTRHPVRDI